MAVKGLLMLLPLCRQYFNFSLARLEPESNSTKMHFFKNSYLLDIPSALVIITRIERQMLERVSGQPFRESPDGARRPARRKNPLRLPEKDVALVKVKP
jgi:hypothetical protein